MTSDSTGIQWVPKPLNQSSAHVFKHPTQRIPPFTGTENHPSRSDAEPALKKQKLDHETDWSALLPPSFSTHEHHKTTQNPCSQLSEPSNLQTYNAPKHPASQSNAAHIDSPATPSLVYPSRSRLDQHQARRNRQSALTQRLSRNVGAVQTKPFILEPPAAVPRYPSTPRSGSSKGSVASESSQAPFAEAAADFSPWRGTHAEDVLGEATIKHGFYDKIQVSQNESGTARPAAWRNYKQQSGLHALSSLFVSVLDQRQIHGSVTAGCTFKPPPRVTLTDSKREAWLRDLANPTIPLRRLSRTIPHGIRGRPLLDHCLAKNIPISRSLWLAKCVGANEIRAFKRKGASGAFAVGGEAKWIKDWTANVEQFLDALIGTCGSDAWRDNMTYGLRLATHLFAESLLDKDHYFDWLLNTINQVDIETLPVYLLIINSHLKEVGQSRRYGRRLAESLSEQLHRIKNNDSPDLYTAVETKIANLIKQLIVASPTSFLMPRRWPGDQLMLRRVIEASHASLFVDICKRNMRLQVMAGSDPESELKTSQTLFGILDSISPGADISNEARRLWEAAPDSELLVRTCLCWSSSIYGTSYARIYLAARLLRCWSGMELDVESHVLHFFTADAKAADLENASLYRVVVELIRSRHFSVGRYLNWVIANGLLKRYGTTEKVSPAMGLLFELPSHGLSPHISNLRQNLLRSLGVAIDDENRTSTEWKAFIDGNPLDQHNGLFNKSGTGHLPHDRYQHTLAIKLDVGQWMRQKLFNYSESGQAPFQQPQENTKTGARDPQHSIFDESRFRTVLAVLEDLEDFTAIVDLLLFHSKSSDPQLLTAIAVTISHYSDVFLACRKADTTFVRLMQRHADLNGKPGYLALTEALIDLAECLPNRSREARLLRTERQRHESKLSVAACSPISEHMAEALQIENSESSLPCTDDIEQLLASGTSMDKQLLTDVFGLIWKRFEIAWGESIQSGFTAAGLLTRLRPFDVNAVNEMTLCRVDEVLTSGAPGTRKSMWISLICARVISFEQLLSHVKNALKQMDDLGVQCELLAETVGCLTMGRQRADSSISHLYYRFYMQQQKALRGFSASVVSLLQQTLQHAHDTQHDTPESICKLLREPAFMAMLRTLPNSSQQDRENIKEIFNPILTMDRTVQTLGHLVMPSIIEQEEGSNDGELAILFDNVSISSLLHCRLYLEALLTCRSKTTEEAAYKLVLVTSEMLPSSSPRTIELWASIVSGLPQQQRRAVSDKAETEIFALLARRPKPSTEDISKQLAYLLSLVSAADNAVHNMVSATRIIAQVNSTITHLFAGHLSPKGSHDSRTEAEDPDMPDESLDYEKFYALLRLLHIHQTAFSTPNVSEDALTRLLVLLGLLLAHPFPTTYSYLSQDICDLLTIISDSVSPSIQARCLHMLQKQHRLKDPRLRYIFAFSDADEDTWLQLSTGPTSSSSTRQQTLHHFPIRKWETMQDATPLMTENDTSISLSLFGARKSVL